VGQDSNLQPARYEQPAAIASGWRFPDAARVITKKHWEPSSPAIMGRRCLIPGCLSPKSALSSNLANTDCQAQRVVLPAVELCEKLPELMLKVRAAPVGSGILAQDALDLPYSV
jgi:hypothetical protein